MALSANRQGSTKADRCWGQSGSARVIAAVAVVRQPVIFSRPSDRSAKETFASSRCPRSIICCTACKRAIVICLRVIPIAARPDNWCESVSVASLRRRTCLTGVRGGSTGPQFTYGFPAATLGIWRPWLVGAAKWNGQVYQGFGTLASEWQNFVSGRVKEDLAFMQRIMDCRTPDQVWAAHTAFWQRAIEDYGKELGV
jgi:hypothetical protein